MALMRIACGIDTLPVLSRASYAGNTIISQGDGRAKAVLRKKSAEMLHLTSARRYPDAPVLPLPTNVSEIFANETGRFTPERSRDIEAPSFIHGVNRHSSAGYNRPGLFPATRVDMHVDSYDCFGAVSLNGAMQSNVPKPYCSVGKSTHLNMPGSQWACDGKYIAEHMQKSHYRTILFNLPLQRAKGNDRGFSQTSRHPHYVSRMNYSVSASLRRADNAASDPPKKLTRKEIMKKYALEYGKVFFVVHVGVSLISLGSLYAAVSSGIDVTHLAEYWLNELEVEGELRTMVKTSTDFALAYFVHKLIFPLRLFTTLAIVPLIAVKRAVPRHVPSLPATPPIHPKLKKLQELQEKERRALKVEDKTMIEKVRDKP